MEAPSPARRQRGDARYVVLLGAAGLLALFGAGWLFTAGSSLVPRAPLAVLLAVAAVALAGFVLAARRLPRGPMRSMAVAGAVVVGIASVGLLLALFGVVLSTVAGVWPLFLLVGVAAVAVWSWRLGREG